MGSCDFKTNVEDLGEEWTKDSMSTHKKKWRKKWHIVQNSLQSSSQTLEDINKRGENLWDFSVLTSPGQLFSSHGFCVCLDAILLLANSQQLERRYIFMSEDKTQRCQHLVQLHCKFVTYLVFFWRGPKF